MMATCKFDEINRVSYRGEVTNHSYYCVRLVGKRDLPDGKRCDMAWSSAEGGKEGAIWVGPGCCDFYSIFILEHLISQQDKYFSSIRL